MYLKGLGTSAAVKEAPFNTLPNEKIMVYAAGKRDPEVVSTQEYCKRKGNELREAFLNTKSFNVQSKRDELKNILRVDEKPVVKKIHEYAATNGWSRLSLESSDDKLIPVLLYPPPVGSGKIVIISNPDGKENIPSSLVEGFIKSGSGVAVVDLSGTGETASSSLQSYDSVGKLRTLSKSYLLLGKTVLGEWVKELSLVARFINARYKSRKVYLYGSKEAGLAGLYLAALEGNIESVTLQSAPLSYVFDNRDSVEFFSTGIHLPGFLNWGDVSLAAALSGTGVTFIDPVTMSGQKISGDKINAYDAEFEQIRRYTRQKGKTDFKINLIRSAVIIIK